MDHGCEDDKGPNATSQPSEARIVRDPVDERLIEQVTVGVDLSGGGQCNIDRRGSLFGWPVGEQAISASPIVAPTHGSVEPRPSIKSMVIKTDQQGPGIAVSNDSKNLVHVVSLADQKYAVAL